MHKFAVFLCSDRKILHLAEIVYTTSGCDGCDKYQVWCHTDRDKGIDKDIYKDKDKVTCV